MKRLLILFALLSWSCAYGNNFTVESYEWMKTSDFLKKKQQIAKKNVQRKLASNQNLTDDAMSLEMKAFRAVLIGVKNQETKKYIESYMKKKQLKSCAPIRLISQEGGLQTKQEVHQCIEFLDKNYNTFPNDLKLLAAQLVVLKSFRSIAYKMFPLISKEKVTHSILVTRIFKLASFMKINLPTAQWEAGFRYLTEPLFSEEKRIETSDEFQDYIARHITPALVKAAIRIKNIDLKNEKVIWDNQLLYGPASFSDDMKRFLQIGEPEKYISLANLHHGLVWTYRIQAYNISGLMDLAKNIGSLYGFDGFLFRKVEG